MSVRLLVSPTPRSPGAGPSCCSVHGTQAKTSRPLAVPPLRLTDPAASRTDALGYNSIMRGARLARHLLLPLLAILVLFTPVTEARVRDFLRTTGANKIAIRVKPVMVSSAKHQPDRKKKGQKSFDQPKVHRSHYPLASGVALIWSAACSGVAR